MKRAWARLIASSIDAVLRVVVAVLLVLAWLDDDYGQAGVLVGLMVVFQLHDIWRELKSQRRPTHNVTFYQSDRDVNTEAVNQ